MLPSPQTRQYSAFNSAGRATRGTIGTTGYSDDQNGNVTGTTGPAARTIAQTPFNLPSTITQGGTTLSYVYDGAHRRIKETAATPSGTTMTL